MPATCDELQLTPKKKPPRPLQPPTPEERMAIAARLPPPHPSPLHAISHDTGAVSVESVVHSVFQKSVVHNEHETPREGGEVLGIWNLAKGSKEGTNAKPSFDQIKIDLGCAIRSSIGAIDEGMVEIHHQLHDSLVASSPDKDITEAIRLSEVVSESMGRIQELQSALQAAGAVAVGAADIPNASSVKKVLQFLPAESQSTEVQTAEPAVTRHAPSSMSALESIISRADKALQYQRQWQRQFTTKVDHEPDLHPKSHMCTPLEKERDTEQRSSTVKEEQHMAVPPGVLGRKEAELSTEQAMKHALLLAPAVDGPSRHDASHGCNNGPSRHDASLKFSQYLVEEPHNATITAADIIARAMARATANHIDTGEQQDTIGDMGQSLAPRDGVPGDEYIGTSQKGTAGVHTLPDAPLTLLKGGGSAADTAIASLASLVSRGLSETVAVSTSHRDPPVPPVTLPLQLGAPFRESTGSDDCVHEAVTMGTISEAARARDIPDCSLQAGARVVPNKAADTTGDDFRLRDASRTYQERTYQEPPQLDVQFQLQASALQDSHPATIRLRNRRRAQQRFLCVHLSRCCEREAMHQWCKVVMLLRERANAMRSTRTPTTPRTTAIPRDLGDSAAAHSGAAHLAVLSVEVNHLLTPSWARTQYDSRRWFYVVMWLESTDTSVESSSSRPRDARNVQSKPIRRLQSSAASASWANSPPLELRGLNNSREASRAPSRMQQTSNPNLPVPGNCQRSKEVSVSDREQELVWRQRFALQAPSRSGVALKLKIVGTTRRTSDICVARASIPLARLPAGESAAWYPLRVEAGCARMGFPVVLAKSNGGGSMRPRVRLSAEMNGVAVSD
jgi:hypothetical protein